MKAKDKNTKKSKAVGYGTFGRSVLASRPKNVIVSTVVIPERGEIIFKVLKFLILESRRHAELNSLLIRLNSLKTPKHYASKRNYCFSQLLPYFDKSS